MALGQQHNITHAIFIFLIVWEILAAVLSIIGTVRMTGSYRSEAVVFNDSKKFLVTGIALGVALWFGMFIAIAGEWFSMLQSKDWDGQSNAFFLTICFVLFLIYIDKRDVK